MSKVVIRGRDYSSSFEFSDYNPTKGEFVARFQSEGLVASGLVSTYINGEYLPKLFQDLAVNWKGFSKPMSWSSLEGELRISCTSDSLGLITLQIELGPSSHPGPWVLNCNLDIDAGQLESIAKDVVRFFKI